MLEETLHRALMQFLDRRRRILYNKRIEQGSLAKPGVAIIPDQIVSSWLRYNVGATTLCICTDKLLADRIFIILLIPHRGNPEIAIIIKKGESPRNSGLRFYDSNWQLEYSSRLNNFSSLVSRKRLGFYSTTWAGQREIYLKKGETT